MKYYYAAKILVLNGITKVIKKSIGIERLPIWAMDFFLDSYKYNLNRLEDYCDPGIYTDKIRNL